MRQLKYFLALLTVAAIMLGTLPASAKNENINNIEAGDYTNVSTEVSLNYKDYILGTSEIPYGNELILGTDQISSKSSDVIISENLLQSDLSGAILPDDGYISWEFTVDKKCSYVISVEYMAAEQSGGNLEFGLLTDGETPFSEATVISFPRTFIQEDQTMTTSGNDVKASVSEEQKWNTKYISDSSGYIQTPLKFVFEKGRHIITFKGSRGKIAISKLSLGAYAEPLSYAEYANKFNSGDKEVAAQPIVLEGENFHEKNSVTILPATDRSSSLTYPQSASALKLNVVGGSTWKNIGEALTWEFEIKEDGLYEISTRFMQNTKDGIFTCRKLLIDDQLPFSEAASLRFDYDSDWQSEKFSSADGEAYSFYLKKGKHTLTLEAVAGDVADIVSTVSDSLTELNKIYRQIVLITGTSPDKNRDYNFKNLIPDELRKMKEIRDSLQNSVDNINKQAGTNGSFVSIIQKIIFQLEKMTDNPRTIASYFSRFKSNLGSLGEWLLTATAQPLEIDRIYILPAGSDLPKANAGFLKDFWFSLSCFAASYVTDYTSIGQSTGKADSTLTVWIQTGRDQGEVIRELVDSSFSKEYDASVKLQIVATGLLQSVLSGNSPDVVLDCADALPMDYALRNAIVNLAEFDDYNDVAKRFSKASLRPVSFNGAVYGMPQTFDFYMMFYRTDIFSEYGYKVPETWTDLRDLIPSMQRNRLQFGLPHDINMYAAFLYQNGGELYKNSGAATNLDSGAAIATFTDFTEFFTLYDCPVTYDFSNRFRSGEMPIAIAPLTQYNQLTAFAPEIKGMWEMVPIPGTENTDGSVNNTSTGAATYIIMLENCKNKELAWDFMKWFTSTDVQGKYAVQMESILGNCAKVATANVEALKNMTWSSSEYKPLLAQMSNTDAVPQVPGGYYLSRIVGFAFNRIYNNDENPSETLTDYVKELNEEISRKREEFGLAGDKVAK